MSQINNIRVRLVLIRWMQLLGALSLLLCVLSMAGIFLEWHKLAGVFFFTAVIMMALSLVSLVREVLISGGALKILLTQVEENVREEERKS